MRKKCGVQRGIWMAGGWRSKRGGLLPGRRGLPLWRVAIELKLSGCLRGFCPTRRGSLPLRSKPTRRGLLVPHRKPLNPFLNSFLLTSLGKTNGRVSVLAIRQTQRMNSNGTVFLKCGQAIPLPSWLKPLERAKLASFLTGHRVIPCKFSAAQSAPANIHHALWGSLLALLLSARRLRAHIFRVAHGRFCSPIGGGVSIASPSRKPALACRAGPVSPQHGRQRTRPTVSFGGAF
jgi:hypothetical protein